MLVYDTWPSNTSAGSDAQEAGTSIQRFWVSQNLLEQLPAAWEEKKLIRYLWTS